MYGLPLPCISHCLDSYNLWAVLWIARTILLTVSGFAPFILVPSGCRTKLVHVWVSQCTLHVPIISATGWEFFPQELLITLDRYFSKLGTYSSQSFFRNIPLFKTALKKVSRQDAQENTASFAILIFPNLNWVIILPQQPRYSFSE